MIRVLIILLMLCWSTISYTAEKRDILQTEANQVGLENVLVKEFAAIDFPTYQSRKFWNDLPANLKQQYVKAAEEVLDYDWPVVKATDYLEIIRSGDRKQEVYAAPRAVLLALVMGELAEGEGRFLDQIINGVWYYSEQTWWGWSAHLPQPDGLPDIKNPSIDLGVGEISNILSWTWYLFKDEFDRIHPLISKRLKDEIMYKAVIPYYERDDFWWMGFADRSVNNWNPWTNHNMLTSILILEDDYEKKIKGVQKVIRSLDVFINGYPDDGGCDEGPSYWGRAGASLYQNLDLLKRATRGEFDVFDNQLIKNMGSYIYKAYIDYPYFINFADADATTNSRPGIIYRYGKDIQDPTMQKFGAFLAKAQDWDQNTPGGKIDEQIMNLMYLEEILNAPAENALISEFFLPETEIGGARDQAGSTEGFFFAAKGGYNAESHNHNDAGSCVMYYNGKPCLIDLGREKYVAKTFSSRRYEIWTMQSQYHNLPKINGKDQAPGSEYKAKNTQFTGNSRKATFSTDISGAYPATANVLSWERSYTLDRKRHFIIEDDFELNKISENPTTLNLITYCNASRTNPGEIQLNGDGYSLLLQYDNKKLEPNIEFTEVKDEKLRSYWPDGVTRIVFTFKDLKMKGKSQIEISPL